MKSEKGILLQQFFLIIIVLMIILGVTVYVVMQDGGVVEELETEYINSLENKGSENTTLTEEVQEVLSQEPIN